jgi:hypothetical protein
MDGQRIADNPTLAQQGESDKAICEGDAQGAPSSTPVETSPPDQSMASMDSMQSCMAQKGYLYVAADQAEAVREQHAATYAQRQPAPVIPPRRVTRKPKPKPHPPQQSPQPQPQPSQTEQQQPSQTPPWPSPEPPQQPLALPSPK